VVEERSDFDIRREVPGLSGLMF
jgi:hypothetical protein